MIDLWEPIISNEKKYFSKNNDPDNILNKILIENINYYNLHIKNFKIIDDIKIILNEENLINNLDNLDENTFISKENLFLDLKLKDLKKLKKQELEKIAEELGLSININRPKKADYIVTIQNKLNLN